MANLHKWQEFALLATGSSKPACGDLGAQQGSQMLSALVFREWNPALFFLF